MVTISTREHSIKMIVSHPLGISLSEEIDDPEIKAVFYNKKVGSKVEGETIGFPNYTFTITGGSDLAGFPHEKGIKGEGLRRVLRKTPVGSSSRRKKIPKRTGGYELVDLRDVRLRKRVRGEELSEWTRQINLMLTERKGTPIREIEVEKILSDKFLRPIAEKVGDIILRWGFNTVRIVDNSTESSLGEKIKDQDLDESSLRKAKEILGAELMKLEHRKPIFNSLQKVNKNQPPLIGIRVAQELITFYERLKEDLSKEDMVEAITSPISEILKKADAGNLKRKGSFSFTIKEG